MLCRCASARPFVLAAATWSCQAGGGDPSEDLTDAEPQVEQLDFSVDRVDIEHGALRISATMLEGSADVFISLGGECEHREVGGGMATRSSVVWALGADDLAGALGCDLLVTAREATPKGPIVKVAPLVVTAEMAPSAAEETPRLPRVSRSTTEMQLVFQPAGAHERLSVGDSLLAPSSAVSDYPSARFAFPHGDFARAILSQRPLRLGTSSFDPSVSIGGVALELEPPDVPTDDVALPP